MSKAVLISINPEWCDLILRGDKTAEVRKTKPKLETPFKVYIYCTKAPKWLKIASHEWEQRSGKVVGEFICDKIWELAPLNKAPDDFEEMACLDRDEIVHYLNKIHGFGWHISAVKVYDNPRSLTDFIPNCRFGEDGECEYHRVYCQYQNYDYNPDGTINIACCDKRVQKAPQSWCYIEGLHA